MSGTATLDRIALSGIKAVGYHGVFDHERRNGQPFLADVVLYTDIRAAAETDDLTNTINYGELAEQVESIITGEPCNLVETLCERIAAHVLTVFDIAAVDVTVHKPKAPIQVPFDDVSIGIYRRRQ